MLRRNWVRFALVVALAVLALLAIRLHEAEGRAGQQLVIDSAHANGKPRLADDVG